jgi:hypothetical protein
MQTRINWWGAAHDDWPWVAFRLQFAVEDEVAAHGGLRWNLLEMKEVSLERLTVLLPEATSLAGRSLRCCCCWGKPRLYMRKNASGAAVMEKLSWLLLKDLLLLLLKITLLVWLWDVAHGHSFFERMPSAAHSVACWHASTAERGCGSLLLMV